MVTKLMAAKTAVHGGCAMAIAARQRGSPAAPRWTRARGAPGSCQRLSPAAARKQWIAGMKPAGALVVDAGAAAALGAGRSLLPAGVRAVEGEFERG
jgi:glutamate 5-kinase